MKYTLAVVGILGWVMLAAGQAPPPTRDSDLVQVEIKLPRPAETPTPRPWLVLKTVERPTTRPLFMAPKGTVNIALGRPVSSSDNAPSVGNLQMITDGDKEAMEGSWVELGAGLQWVQIDLGASHPIWAVAVWHFHAEPRVYKAVIVQISSDAKFAKDVTTIFNNDVENLAGFGQGKDRQYIESYAGKLMEAKGIEGRYVRFYCAGSTETDMHHYVEVEVYGTPK